MKEKENKYIHDINISKEQARHSVLNYKELMIILSDPSHNYKHYEAIMQTVPVLIIALYKAYYADKQRDNARQRAKRTAGNMTQAQRSERARKAAAKRWHKDLDTLSLNTVQNFKLENAINKKHNKQKQPK